METKQFFDCEKHSGKFQEEIIRTNDFSHILNVESKNFATLIIGLRGCGKTHLIKDIINKYNTKNLIDDIYIFTWNKDVYDDIVENKNCIINLNNDIDNDIEKYFEKIISKRKKIINPKKTIVIIDDNLSNFKKLSNIMLNIHNLGIDLYLSVQYSIGISPEARTQFDYVIIFKEYYLSNIKRSYEHYFGMYKFKSYEQIISNLDSYEFIIRTDKSNIKQDRNKFFICKSNCNNYQSKIKLTNIDLNDGDNNDDNNNDNNNDNKIKLKNRIIKIIEKNNLKLKKLADENNKIINENNKLIKSLNDI